MKNEDLLPCLLTQQEIDDFANMQPQGLTTDDIYWFTYGEKEVRSWLPHMEKLTKLIIARQNLKSIYYYKQQIAMKKAINNVIDSNSIEQLNCFVKAGQSLLKEKHNNNQ